MQQQRTLRDAWLSTLTDLGAVTESDTLVVGPYAESVADQLPAPTGDTTSTVATLLVTPVPEGAKGRVPGDAAKYNAIAAGIMQEHGILTDDLFAFAQAQLSTIQQPANVHFTPAGSRDLAKQVAGKIEATLKKE